MQVKIFEDEYKGKKRITMESERLMVSFIPVGSRMVSLIDKSSGREFLLQGKSEKCITGTYDSYLPDFDPFGFDEMFPTINECFYEDYPWKGVRIPDHGEVWSLEWDCGIYSDDSLGMSVHGIRLPYRLEKRISFRQDHILRIDYRACNLSPFYMNFLWAAHPMIKVEENSEVILPPESKTGFCVYDDGGRLGGFGSLFDISGKVGNDGVKGGEVTHVIRDRSYKCTEKYYIHDRLSNGRCGIRYLSDGTVIMLDFPIDTVPYLGVLVADGGIDDNGCVAILEPCTAPYDRLDMARAFTGGSVLKAKGIYTWYLEFEIIKQ